MKIKFLALAHPIKLHHRDGMYYLILSTIVLHNMMVEECVSNDEMEDVSFYNVVDPNDSEDNSTEEDDNMDDRRSSGYGNSPQDRHEKFKMVH